MSITLNCSFDAHPFMHWDFDVSHLTMTNMRYVSHQGMDWAAIVAKMNDKSTLVLRDAAYIEPEQVQHAHVETLDISGSVCATDNQGRGQILAPLQHMNVQHLVMQRCLVQDTTLPTFDLLMKKGLKTLDVRYNFIKNTEILHQWGRELGCQVFTDPQRGDPTKLEALMQGKTS